MKKQGNSLRKEQTTPKSRGPVQRDTKEVMAEVVAKLAGKAAADLGDISEEKILKTVREYRTGRKKLPEITVVARTKKKTA